MIVLSEASDQLPPSPSARDLHASTEAARLTGCHVYFIPQDFSVCETAENALGHIPDQEYSTPAAWVGYIPSPEHYSALSFTESSGMINRLLAWLPNSLQEGTTAK